MGLDMYLSGEKFLWGNFQDPSQNRMEDGFRISAIELSLGYWRKHPDLHGYIVQTFANGVDECQRIELDSEQLRAIIEAIKNKKLPKTTGFFFGASDGSELESDVKIFESALAWLQDQTPAPQFGPSKALDIAGFVVSELKLPQTFPKETRSVYYKASW